MNASFAVLTALLVILTFGVYPRVRANHYLSYDDYSCVTGNHDVSHRLSGAGIARAFTSVEPPNRHPVTWPADGTHVGRGQETWRRPSPCGSDLSPCCVT